MLAVASSLQTYTGDPSPEAKVNTNEKTACFRKPRCLTVAITVDTGYNSETRGSDIPVQFSSSSEGSSPASKEESSSSSHQTVEYERLHSSDEIPPEDPAPPAINIPKLQKCNLKQCKTETKTYTGIRKRIEPYLDFSLRAIYSWSLLPIYALLIAAGSQAVYMGLKYDDLCPYLDDSSMMYFLMGCFGIGAVVFHVLSVMQKRCIPDSSCLSTTQVISFLLSVFYLGTFLIEIQRFMSVDGMPSHLPGPTYCHPYFYSFVCWSNWTLSMLTLVVFSFFAPPLFISVFIHC